MLGILTAGFARRRFLRMTVLVAGCAVLVACGGTTGAAQPPGTSAATEPPEPADTPTAVPKAVAGAFVIEIGTGTGATEFRYTKPTLEAPAGSKITIKFRNNTKMADEVGHNWVLVKPGQETSVLANGIAAGDDRDWLQVGDPGIIAHTALIEGQATDTITFDAPAPGTYTYLSTFPKQYEAGMKGVLTVK